MSNLRYSTSISALPSQITRTTTSPPPEKQKKMSLTQTYMLAHSARGKLSKEAARPAHDLRRLVGHANMLDNLMLDLSNAEEEQENWFNQSVKSADKAASEPKHVSWVETIPEEVVDDDEYDSESDDEEVEVAQSLPLRRVAKSPPPPPVFDDEDTDMEEDDEYDDGLALTRTDSHPPELMQDTSESESEDEMPPSPPATTITFDRLSQKQRQAIATTSFYQTTESLSEAEDSLFDHVLPAPISAF